MKERKRMSIQFINIVLFLARLFLSLQCEGIFAGSSDGPRRPRPDIYRPSKTTTDTTRRCTPTVSGVRVGSCIACRGVVGKAQTWDTSCGRSSEPGLNKEVIFNARSSYDTIQYGPRDAR